MATKPKPGMLTGEELLAYEGLVAAYRNLHFKQEIVYSVRDRKRDRLIAYTPAITLRDAVFRIKASEQRRAVLRHERNVHAFADGFVVPTGQDGIEGWRTARYNVFKWDTFVDADTETPILRARYVHLGPSGMLYVPEENTHQ